MIRISVDPGFGNFKVATVASGSNQIAVVPSVVGVGETDLGMLSLGDLGRRRRRKQPDRVTTGGVTYLVGKEVARFARPVQRMDFLRLSDGPELRALFYAAAFRLLDRLRVLRLAVSLGGTETLICHPASTTHYAVSRERREAVGIDDATLRISVGIEHADDLAADLTQALEAV